MRFKLLIPIAALCISPIANALDITTTEAGTLATAIGDNTAVSTLTVTGPINAVDIEYINGTLTSLTDLNLSEATIMPVSGVKSVTGTTEFKADALPHYAFFGTKIASITLPRTLVTIGESALGNSSLTSIEIPASVTTIADYAFVKCDNLLTVTVPPTVTDLGAGVFMDCRQLASATIESNSTAIKADMFNNCQSLATVNLPASVESLGDRCFANCPALKEFDFGASLTTIGAKSFYDSGLTAVNLDKSTALTTIGDYAFAKCGSLKSVKMNGSTPTLGQGLFFDDTALTTVQLPASATVIPAFTFKGTNSINAETALSDDTREIGDYALYGWDKTTEFKLPDNLSSIGSGAMEGWTSLKDINGRTLTAVPALGDNVWEGVNQPEVNLLVKNAEMQSQFNNADQWKDFTITISTTGSDSIINDATGNGDAKVDFNVGNGYLRITSSARDIARVNIYDLNGRSRYTVAPDAASVTIATSQWTGTILVVDATLTDGSRATIKLSI